MHGGGHQNVTQPKDHLGSNRLRRRLSGSVLWTDKVPNRRWCFLLAIHFVKAEYPFRRLCSGTGLRQLVRRQCTLKFSGLGKKGGSCVAARRLSLPLWPMG